MFKKIMHFILILLILNIFYCPFVFGVNLIDNNPPNPPIINGLKSGIIGEEYIFNVILTDPDQDDILKNLEVDFGDGILYENCGCGLPWHNGTSLDISHEWEESGIYEITARVQDLDLVWSNWSDPFIFVVTNDVGYTNITVEEAWELLNDISNGIQIPIDVRTDYEWANEHINTPSPENSKHHCLCELEDETILQEFLSLYEGEVIIVYCLSGGRSATASSMFVDNGFIGIIYNMVGGINAWKDAGFPTIPNLPPEIPTISGPLTGKPDEVYNFTISTTDPDGDIVYYFINWSDNSSISQIGPYESNEEVIISHSWLEKGSYIIKVKAMDYYQDESDWGTQSVNMSRYKFINILNNLFLRLIDQFLILQYLFY
jgi:rhodanese-related sulfurtransferase